MESLPLTPTTLAGGGMAPEHDQAPTSVERSTGEAASRMIRGRPWTVRNGFERVIESIDPDAWGAPARHGWRQIKHNAIRDVWRTAGGGTTIFVKYFMGCGILDRVKDLLRAGACRKEWNGGMFALRAGIAAARPAAYTENVIREGRRCAVLVTEAIEPAYSLSDFWSTLQADADETRRREDAAQLIERLAEMIARAHQSGFEHLDMHSANILVQPLGRRRYRTVLVDLQSARLDRPVTDAAVVRNLAQLNQWFRRHSGIKDRLRFLRAYLRWRNEYETEFPHGRPLGLSYRELVRALVRAAGSHAERLWAQRDRRIQRSGRYFGRIRADGGWSGTACLRCKHELEGSPTSRITFSADWWAKQLADPLRFFKGGGVSCKNSHSAEVTRALLPHAEGELPVIVKRPLARDWRRRLRNWLGASRCARAFRMGHAMLHRDLPTARPLAYVERRAGGLVHDSLLVTEAVPGGRDLDAAIRAAHGALPAREFRGFKREIGTLLVRLLRQFSANGFVHRDCKAQNILLTSLPAPRLIWIDLDGVRRVRAPQEADMLRALARLHVSLLDVPGLTRTDRARVLKGCLARYGARRDDWRAAWRTIAALADEKLIARQKRRAWKLRHYGRE